MAKRFLFVYLIKFFKNEPLKKKDEEDKDRDQKKKNRHTHNVRMNTFNC